MRLSTNRLADLQFHFVVGHTTEKTYLRSYGNHQKYAKLT